MLTSLTSSVAVISKHEATPAFYQNVNVQAAHSPGMVIHVAYNKGSENGELKAHERKNKKPTNFSLLLLMRTRCGQQCFKYIKPSSGPHPHVFN